MEELIDTGQSDVVCRLAFKYMEMCKVDSSSDSESEMNPRWSDVSSSKGWESSAPESREAPRRLQRSGGYSYQKCLDPYDGSSEDSGASPNDSRKQRPGGLRVKGATRRSAFIHPSIHRDTRRGATRPDPADVQMRSSSDSELETVNQAFCSSCRTSTCAKVDQSDSGFNTRSCISSPAVASGQETILQCRIQSGSPDGPAVHAAFSKRKFFPLSGEVDDGMRRKRQCISDMEVESVVF